jgi:lipoate-protein ligase A
MNQGETARWYLLQSGPGEPASNMAWDETLLEFSARLGKPVLRFYSWTEAAATFGYSQSYSDIASATPLRPLIRRPTGGGLVPHDKDWTYSLIFPPNHFWYLMRAGESYQRLHEWVRDAFAKLSVPTELTPGLEKEVLGQCFIGAEKSDLLWSGRKIAGAAQRRARIGMLIQGSIQPPPVGVPKIDWQNAMCDVAREQLSVDWLNLQPDREMAERMAELVRQKYSQRSFNEKR